MNYLKDVHRTLLMLSYYFIFASCPFLPFKEILCSTPGNIKNGRFTVYKDEYHYNEVVTYMCDPSNGLDEYSLVGESRLICVDQDRWSSDPPECKGNNISIYFLLSLQRPWKHFINSFTYK